MELDFRSYIASFFFMFLVAMAPTRAMSQTLRRDSVFRSVDKAHTEIWRRFVNKQFNILYDYTDQNGNVHLPAAGEVQKLLPNGLSYTTVIEDGAFYNGIYLDGLCERWKKLKTKQAAEEARSIAKALVKLATVSEIPGFIARNILPDGKTYYPASSDDQTFPWFYGMWKYLISGIPNPSEKDQLKKLIIEKATALHAYSWNIPCDPISFGYYGSFSKAGNKHLVRIPFVTRIVYELTHDQKWMTLYKESLREIPPGEKQNRTLLLANGIAYGQPGSNPYNFWLSASSQAALKELLRLETDAEIRVAYRSALQNNGRKATAHMRLYDSFDNTNTFIYDIDWRKLNSQWRPQKDCWEARKLGLEQVGAGYMLSPRNRYEYDYMTEPLFAAWVIVMSEDNDLIQSVRYDLRKILTHYDWTKIYTAPFFIVESVYFEGLKYDIFSK